MSQGGQNLMSVTPIVATHRVSFKYRTDGLVHVIQAYCDALPLGVGAGHTLVTRTLTSILAATAFSNFATQLAATLLTTDTVDDWTLEQYSGGSYIPVETGALGLAGSQVAAGTPFSRITGFYRTTTFKPVKAIVICGTYFTPLHENPTALPNPFKAWWISWYGVTSADIGWWAEARDASFLASNTFITGSLDRKSRRRAGLV
jgi:hypothetical protein